MRLLILLIVLSAGAVSAQTPVAQGVYRMPFEDGTQVSVSNSHDVHRNRLDMSGQGGGPYTIVAAAAGTVRVVVDNNNTICPRPPAVLNSFDVNGNGSVSAAEIQLAFATNQAVNSPLIMAAAISVCAGFDPQPHPPGNTNIDTTSMCCMRGLEPLMTCAVGGAPAATCTAGVDGDGPNNYIWIEHVNGEWTKYTHTFLNGALVEVGDNVTAGAPIAIQGNVGIATGPHLHFHVAALDNVDQIGATGFAVNDDGIAGINVRHRVPVFCQHGLLEDNETINSAQPCDDLCSNANEIVGGLFNNEAARLTQVSNQITTTATVAPGSGLSVRAGQRILIRPGFDAQGGSFFAATIGGCDQPGGVGE